jgi:hypothetical protein
MGATDTEEGAAPAAPAAAAEYPRNVAYARVWTSRAEPVGVAALSDELYARGFMPGVTDPAGTAPMRNGAGLADARFEIGGEGFRFVSLSSAKGQGCVVTVKASDATELPDDRIAKRTVPRPKLCYTVQAGGPAHSDRNLCENLAEALLLMTGGLVELGGLGTKGNRPNLYKSRWVGDVHAR